jgi:hypothetical protein
LPSVIETHPVLENGEPFPTLWWLTCRRLAAAVGRLEGEGFMAEINRRLASDAGFREALEMSTRLYIDRRDSLAPLGEAAHPGGGFGGSSSPPRREAAYARGCEPPEIKRGSSARVKCLHAHVAHQLVAGDNPVGAAVLEKIGWAEPGEPCVRI